MSAAVAEARHRSWHTNLGTTTAAFVLLVFLYGTHTASALGVAAVLIAWVLFQSAYLSLRRLGHEHPASRALASLDDLGRPGAVLLLVYLTGTAVTPLWSFDFACAFVWQARPAARGRMALVALVVVHGALALALVLDGRLADAAFTGLALCAVVIAHTSSARAAQRAAELKNERDLLVEKLQDARIRSSRERLARELHDGVGAEVTALLLRLRREARRGTRADAAALMERVQLVLDELRSVVWSLRNEQGTLAELGKLIDASCRRLVDSVSYARKWPEAPMQRNIEASAALQALECARTMLATAVAMPDVRSVELVLEDGESLVLRVQHDGASPLEPFTIALDQPARAG